MTRVKEKRDSEMDFTITGNLKRQAAYDIMCSIVECDSSGYWSEVGQVTRDSDLNILSFQMWELNNPNPSKLITPAVILDAMVRVAKEGRGAGHGERKDIILALMTGDTCDIDNGRADIIAQVAVLGSVNFG